MPEIEHLIEPMRLLLSWQPRRVHQERFGRMRRIVGELVRHQEDADLRYFTDDEDFQAAQAAGFSGYPGYPVIEAFHRNVLETFLKRLPPRSRTDYNRFLQAIRIPEEATATISDFALLGYSGAKLPDDDFSLIHPFENVQPPFEFLTRLQGFRFHIHALQGKVEDLLHEPVFFERESANPADPEAVAVFQHELRIGYITRGLNLSFVKWMEAGYVVSGRAERINGTQADPAVYLWISVQFPDQTTPAENMESIHA